MKRLVCLLMIALLIVAGCAKKDEEKKAVCRITEDGISDEMTIEALNDTVMRSKSVMKLPFSLYDLTTDDEKAQFAEQLDRLQLDYIDFYLLHGLQDHFYEEMFSGGCVEYFNQMKAEGKTNKQIYTELGISKSLFYLKMREYKNNIGQ